MRAWLAILAAAGGLTALVLVTRKAAAREPPARGAEPEHQPDPAAAVEARLRAALRAGGVDNFDLSVVPGTRTITIGAYRDAAQVQVALAPLQDASGGIDGYAVRLAGPRGGGGGVMSRMDAIQQLQQDLAAEQAKRPVDPEKVRRLEVMLGQLAQAELDARHAAKAAAPAPAAHPDPLYPVGTQASFGGYTGTIVQAWWDVGRWNYTVKIMGFEVVRSEQQVKDELASRLGQPKGPAYPKGLTVMRQGKGGLVEAATLEGGVYRYQLKGWPNPITELELQKLLVEA